MRVGPPWRDSLSEEEERPDLSLSHFSLWRILLDCSDDSFLTCPFRIVLTQVFFILTDPECTSQGVSSLAFYKIPPCIYTLQGGKLQIAYRKFGVNKMHIWLLCMWFSWPLFLSQSRAYSVLVFGSPWPLEVRISPSHFGNLVLLAGHLSVPVLHTPDAHIPFLVQDHACFKAGDFIEHLLYAGSFARIWHRPCDKVPVV